MTDHYRIHLVLWMLCPTLLYLWYMAIKGAASIKNNDWSRTSIILVMIACLLSSTAIFTVIMASQKMWF